MSTTEEVLDARIDELTDNFSLRTINALMNNDITTVRELVVLRDEELKNLRGFGTRALDQVKGFEFDLSTGGVELPKPKVTEYKLHEWMVEKLKERQADALKRYYGLDREREKGIDIAKEYGVSRERVRQILLGATRKIAKAIDTGEIEPEMVEKIRVAAENGTCLNNLNDLSPVYNSASVAEMIAVAKGWGRRTRIDGLKSDWLVSGSSCESKIEDDVMKVLKWLECQPGLVPIEALAEQAEVSKELIFDLDSVRFEGEYVALINGYNKHGIDRSVRIRSYMVQKVKPVTVKEIKEEFELASEEVARNILINIPGVVNVGKSVYGLTEYGYSNLDTRETIIDYLKQCGEPRHFSEIVRYVKHYRVVDDTSITAAIYAHPEDFTRFSDGYVALAEWGYSSDAEKRKVFEVTAREAVLEVLKEATEAMSNKEITEAVRQKFGNRATDAQVTISMASKALEDDGVLERLGNGNTAYYKIKA